MYCFIEKEKGNKYQVFNNLEKASKPGPRFPSHRFLKKTIDIIGISDSALRRIVKNKDNDNESIPKTKKKIEAIQVL